MNTYTVLYWPPGAPGSTTVTVTAAEYVSEEHYLVFYDNTTPAPQPILSVPHSLDPVVQRTATA